MDMYQILTICGVGALSSLIVTYLFTTITDHFRKKREESKEEREARIQRWETKMDELGSKIDSMNEHVTETTDRAIQALLRNKLYEIYDYWMPKKYAPTDVKENFENLYIRYHCLGKNGVMDNKREAFMKLPDTKPSKSENK